VKQACSPARLCHSCGQAAMFPIHALSLYFMPGLQSRLVVPPQALCCLFPRKVWHPQMPSSCDLTSSLVGSVHSHRGFCKLNVTQGFMIREVCVVVCRAGSIHRRKQQGLRGSGGRRPVQPATAQTLSFQSIQYGSLLRSAYPTTADSAHRRHTEAHPNGTARLRSRVARWRSSLAPSRLDRH
jgi:hypothetical protein